MFNGNEHSMLCLLIGMNKTNDQKRKRDGYREWKTRNDLSLIYLSQRNNMDYTTRVPKIQRYLTGIMLQDDRMSKYITIIDTAYF